MKFYKLIYFVILMYTAVIVEPRMHPCLPIVLNNFNNNLDERWNFLVFHGANNKMFIKNIFRKMKTTKNITYVNLKKNNLPIKEYNQLLYSHYFYSHIPTENFLIFQTDALISPIYKDNIYKFLEYDYVGAPWKNRNNEIGNGGLSFRKKSKMLELLNKNFPPKLLNFYSSKIPEDLFFSGTGKNLNNIYVHKPDVELAKEFSTETIFSSNSFGLHKPWLYLNKIQLNKLKSLFPKLHMLMYYTKLYRQYVNQQNKVGK